MLQFVLTCQLEQAKKHVLELEAELVTAEIMYAVHAMRAAISRSDFAPCFTLAFICIFRMQGLIIRMTLALQDRRDFENSFSGHHAYDAVLQHNQLSKKAQTIVDRLRT